MFKVLGFLILGFAISRFLPRNKNVESRSNLLVVLAIYALLFFMGVSIGSNKEIFSALPTLGLTAVAIGAASILGSSIASYFLFKKYFNKSDDGL